MGANSNQTRDQYQKELSELLTCRPVAYWPILARVFGGVQEAILLSQLLYWNGVHTVQNRGGWLWKSVQDMTDETGLSKEQQQTARAALARLGVIEIALKGVPRCWRYRVDMDKLAELIAIHSERLPSNGNAVEWDEYSTVNPPNIGRNSRGMFDGKPVQHSTENPSNLNKNQRVQTESTNIDYPYTTTTTTGKNGTNKAAGLGVVVLDESLIAVLDRIGIMPGRRAAVLSAAREYGWAADTLSGLVDHLKQEYGPERAAHLLEYRIKNDEPGNFAIRNEYGFGLCPVCNCLPCQCEEWNETENEE